MFRPLLLTPVMLLAGCISLSSTESPSAPDYAGFCREKEMQCKEICGGVGVQLFSCKAAPREGLEYQCQCKKPGQQL
ncbi:MAG: hypothetical protein H6R09_584 [Proteobacteria bacterium]|jgi:hypothetical protein|nr:hypothetical protein [Pseudomonadota bacterium]